MALPSSVALLNVGRLNAFRLNAIPAALTVARAKKITVTLNGAPLKVRYDTITIRDVINDSPNTCSLVVDADTPPTAGGRLRIVLGVDPTFLLFVGALQAANETYVGRSSLGEQEWACEAIDDTKRADWLLPFGAWVNVSATTVAKDLIATFAPGFTSTHVQAGLPPVVVFYDGTEGMTGALRQLAKLIGGYFYFEDYDLHLFAGDEAGEAPADITGAPGQLLDEPRITATRDDAQLRTRCYGKGHAEATTSDVAAGASIVPIANAVMFNPAGGRAISEWQRFTYTGISLGGDGALVGPGVTPSAALTVAGALGTGIPDGPHGYAFTWVTASGETLPSPIATLTHGGVASPTVAPTFLGHGGPIGSNDAGDPSASGVWKPGDTVEIGYSYATAQNTTLMTPLSPTISIVAVAASGSYPSGTPAKSLYIQIPYSSDDRVQWLIVWHRINGGAWRWWQGTSNHVPPSYGSVFPRDLTNGNIYSAGGASPPTAALAFNQTAVSGIAVGPAAVTARKIYRTVAYGSQLKLLTTIANNTATTYTDAAADGALGANAPGGDTSALQQPAGQVLPGATSVMVTSTAFASPSGGFVVLGNGEQIVRYTGISGNTLTGIPASGSGAVTAPVNYNSSITGAALLTGVSGLVAPLIEGAPVNLWVQRDDTAAQAALAARAGGSGIIEHLISDERRGEPSLTALCDADLAMYSRPIITVRYACFDPKSKSGKPIRVVLPALDLDDTLTIQDVTIDHLGTRARFTVTASSVRTSLEDLLRRMVGTLDEGF